MACCKRRYRKGKEKKEKAKIDNDKKENIDDSFEAQKSSSKELTSFDE